ncbi:unnamed protein product [Parnassius apollo]|uniref:(apollo) hypothetical protein n=1 Tax=Parnassius apollo TaxID=110799 RepID=A0A8S3XL62_PARAO|nr:unnamed protein product [Parnassius apollo]
MARNLNDNDISELLLGEIDSELECLIDFQPCDDENISDNEVPQPEISSNSSDSLSDSDILGEEEHEDAQPSSGTYYRGKNKIKWSKNPPSSSRIRSHNIISHLPDIVGPAREKHNMSPIES